MLSITPKSLLLSFAAVAAAGQFHRRQDSDGQVSFELYAYGEGIGGLPITSTGSNIIIGEPNSLNDTEAAVVVFVEGTDGTWLGSPNSTRSIGGTATWGNLTLSVPGPSSAPDAVRLDESSNSTIDRVNNGFGFYGTIAFHTSSDGAFESLWFANASATDGVWNLQWNETENSEALVPLTLKSTPPSGNSS